MLYVAYREYQIEKMRDKRAQYDVTKTLANVNGNAAYVWVRDSALHQLTGSFFLDIVVALLTINTNPGLQCSE